MTKKNNSEQRRNDDAEIDFLPTIDSELVEDSIIKNESKTKIQTFQTESENQNAKIKNQKLYLLLPIIFLTVTLLGGLRFAAADGSFLFLKPALICLIFAAVLLVLYFRATLINLNGWFSEEFSTLKNAANFGVLLTLFTASVQVFNALLPERGLPFWIVGFCFFWTLWTNLFADFDVKKLLRSLGALFGLAFVVKYILLANLTAPTAENWWQSVWQNPTKEAFTWALDLPRFSAATGYVQFFTLVFYLIGLFMFPPTTKSSK